MSAENKGGGRLSDGPGGTIEPIWFAGDKPSPPPPGVSRGPPKFFQFGSGGGNCGGGAFAGRALTGFFWLDFFATHGQGGRGTNVLFWRPGGGHSLAGFFLCSFNHQPFRVGGGYFGPLCISEGSCSGALGGRPGTKSLLALWPADYGISWGGTARKMGLIGTKCFSFGLPERFPPRPQVGKGNPHRGGKPGGSGLHYKRSGGYQEENSSGPTGNAGRALMATDIREGHQKEKKQRSGGQWPGRGAFLPQISASGSHARGG